jgi:hypothetical protein
MWRKRRIFRLLWFTAAMLSGSGTVVRLWHGRVIDLSFQGRTGVEQKDHIDTLTIGVNPPQFHVVQVTMRCELQRIAESHLGDFVPHKD